MRIGYISHQFPPETGAGAARVSEMGRRWLASGARVTVITSMPNRPQGRIHPEYRRRLFTSERMDGIEVLRCWLHATPRHGFAATILNNLTFMATAGVRAAIAARRFDILIASAPPFFIQPAGVAATAVGRVPLVTELRDLWPDYMVDMGVIRKDGALARSLFLAERVMLRRSRHVVVVTDSFRRHVRGKGVPDGRISVIPNGVDSAAYFPVPDPTPPFPEMARRNGELVAGYLGNFGAGQRIDLLVDVAARLDGAGVRLVLVGDGTERERVERRARETGFANLSLLPAIPKDRTREFYNACDICLVPLAPIPAFQDTIPSKLFEVLACGRPVVGSVAGEAASIIDRSGGGMVCAPGDVDGIARALSRMAELPAGERESIGRKGVDFVRRSYDRMALADEYLGLLERIAVGDESAHATEHTGTLVQTREPGS